MNDDNKILNQNMPPAVQVVQSQPQAAVQPAQPPNPVGSVNKEVGTVGVVSDFIKPSEAEPQISNEPEIEDEYKQVINHAKQFTPVPSTSSGKTTMLMSEEEIADKLKLGRGDDSGKWLASLLKKIITVIGFQT
jgi:hypothetical protein